VLFASSRQVVVGPSSTVAVLSASAAATVTEATHGDFLAITAGLALVIGCIYPVLGIVRMGWISRFLSRSVLTGFTFGLAMTIAVGQAPKLFGVESGSGNFFDKAAQLVRELPNADRLTTLIGLSSLAVLFAVRARFGHRVPVALVVLAVSIVLSSILDWHAHGVHVVGEIPAGLPSLRIPVLTWEQLAELIVPAMGIVLVGYAESYAGARSLAERHRQDVSADQEMIALGAANIGSALTGGFTVDASLPRSAAADEAGVKTQMSGLMCLGITIVTVIALTPLFRNLPDAVLAAVVISAIWGLFDIGELRRIGRSNRYDLFAALGALVGVCVFDLLPGLLVAVAISFLMLVYRASTPQMTILARSVDKDVYVARERWVTTDIPGIVILRFEAPLFFANGDALRTRLGELANQPSVGTIILDCESILTLDTDGADALRNAATSLRQQGVVLRLARLGHKGREALRRADAYDVIGTDHVHLSVRDAVLAVSGHQPRSPSL
jgi:high affinity sulfate transporter 1